MSPSGPLALLSDFATNILLGTALPLGLGLAVSAAFVTLASRLKSCLNGAAGERAVARRLRRLGFPCLHNVIVPAPDGSLTRIDHVVLTADGPLAITTKPHAGLVFGRQQERYWTQAHGGRRTRFRNPLRQNLKNVAALRHHLSVEVQGLVVFAGTARFQNPVPQGVVTLRDLAGQMKRLGRPSPVMLAGPTWQAAGRLAEQGRGLRQAPLAGPGARRPPAPRRPAGRGASWFAAITEAARRRYGAFLKPAFVRGFVAWPPVPPSGLTVNDR